MITTSIFNPPPFHGVLMDAMQNAIKFCLFYIDVLE